MGLLLLAEQLKRNIIIGVNCMFARTPIRCVCNTWLAVYLCAPVRLMNTRTIWLHYIPLPRMRQCPFTRPSFLAYLSLIFDGACMEGLGTRL